MRINRATHTNDFWNQIIEQHYTSSNKKIFVSILRKNNHAYVLYEDTALNIQTIDVIIPIKHHANWSYKIYNEQTHPLYFICTKNLLSQSTNNHPRAVSWRNKCLEVAHHGLHKRKLMACISDFLFSGMIIDSDKYGKIKFIKYTEKNKGFVGLHINSNCEYHYRFGLFQLGELERFINDAIMQKNQIQIAG